MKKDREAMQQAAMLQAQGLRFVQIAVSHDNEGGETLYGLTAEGKVYEEHTAYLYHQETGERRCFTWWQPLPMSTEMSLQHEVVAKPIGWDSKK